MHELFHSGYNAHVCKFCDKSFIPASDLKRHELIHREEKTYVWKFCGKNSTEPGTLMNHELIHTCEKAHICKFYGKTFFLCWLLEVACENITNIVSPHLTRLIVIIAVIIGLYWERDFAWTGSLSEAFSPECFATTLFTRYGPECLLRD